MDVFSEQGFSAASTSEIAKRAGVAAGTVFRFYKTKNELLVGVVAPLFRRFVAPVLVRDFERVLSTPYPGFEDFLRALLRDRLEFVRRHRVAVRIALQETPTHPELRTLWNEAVVREIQPAFVDLIERFQKEGQVIEMPPATAARAVVSVLAGYALARFLLAPDAEWDDDAEIEAMVRLLTCGLTLPAGRAAAGRS
jgi:AcrR family transcriptional regulator